MSKQQLRSQLSGVLSAISHSDILAQSEVIKDRLGRILEGKRDVACYMSMDEGEVDTGSIIETLFSQGKRVYLPRCTTTKRTGQVPLRYSVDNPETVKHHPHLTFHEMKTLGEVKQLTKQGKYGLKEPLIEDEKLSPLPPHLDVILVPGVAFTAGCARLGHGAGYYDDFFKRYALQHQGTAPLLVGISLKQQIIDKIPMDAHDRYMDCVVAGDGSLYCHKI
ncbi:Uncharacterized protein RNJ44_00335 [Nakaseomyces bracarensis]|uniref:5-formyltetrahydrofolate cyclo-ligase n=1 Tax=Nakaseomyces bracarensis TaxID=273131 RepID=A0ABR4NTK0_9SACH